MPIYKYTLTAEIEVDAPNIMAAEKAVRLRAKDISSHQEILTNIGTIRVTGNTIRMLKLPSQREGEPRVKVRITIGQPTLEREKTSKTTESADSAL